MVLNYTNFEILKMSFSCLKYSQHTVGLIILREYAQPLILSNLSAINLIY